jgi:hypothetical protein
MAYHICPVCGEESIATRCVADGDGDGIYTRSWVAPEFDEQTCKCELTPEQEEALLKENTCEPDDDY